MEINSCTNIQTRLDKSIRKHDTIDINQLEINIQVYSIRMLTNQDANTYLLLVTYPINLISNSNKLSLRCIMEISVNFQKEFIS